MADLYLVDEGNGVLAVVSSEKKIDGAKKLKQGQELFTNETELAGAFPEVFSEEG